MTAHGLALLIVLASTAAAQDSVSTVAELQVEARALAPLYKTPLVSRFLAATSALPSIAPRVVLHDSARTRYYSEATADALPESSRTKLVARRLDEAFYYTTRYGSPLAYSRPLEILAEAGLDEVANKKLVDFGYGTVGHLRLLATLGATVVGVEVDPLLQQLYGAPGDQGEIPTSRMGPNGLLTLVHGRFPAESTVTRSVGEGYDLFISKNTLKNGYIHPAEPVDPRRMVHLGVDDTAFVQHLYRVLAPGGFALIYNLCPAPAPAGKPYIPWADGRSPFSEALWKSAGFRIIAFDRNDDRAARAMGGALGWHKGEGAMDLEKGLFGTYTLVQKPASPPSQSGH